MAQVSLQRVPGTAKAGNTISLAIRRILELIVGSVEARQR